MQALCGLQGIFDLFNCKTPVKNLVPIDREVTAMNGRYYTLRIAPYRTTENSIRGLVITIIDSLGAQN